MSRSTIIAFNIVAFLLLILAGFVVVNYGIPALNVGAFPQQPANVEINAQPTGEILSPGEQLTHDTQTQASDQNPTSTPTVARSGSTNTTAPNSSAQETLVTLINTRRSEQGLPPMVHDAALQQVAEHINTAMDRDAADINQLLYEAGYLSRESTQTVGTAPNLEQGTLTSLIDSNPQLMEMDYLDIGFGVIPADNGDVRYVLVSAAPRSLTAPGTDAANAGERTQAGQQASIVDLLNAARQDAGLPTLSVNDQLAESALVHSEDQAQRSVLSHTGEDQSDVSDRVERTGYTFRTVGENVLQRPNIHASGAFNQWWNSEGHYENMMSADFREIGIAYAVSADEQVYYTMVLGSS